MRRPLMAVAGGLVLALATGCSSGETTAEPQAATTSGTLSQVSPASKPSPTPLPAKVRPSGVADTVPLRAFPILTSPCKYLRRADFLEAKGTQTWRAYESKKTPRSADWAKFALFPDLARAATQGSQCTAVASAKRGIVLSVFVFRTTTDATRQLAPNQNWPGLGEQADLGSVDRGGSGFVRVGRVMIHVTVLYDGLAGEAGQRAVHGVLTDLMPGLPRS